MKRQMGEKMKLKEHSKNTLVLVMKVRYAKQLHHNKMYVWHQEKKVSNGRKEEGMKWVTDRHMSPKICAPYAMGIQWTVMLYE